jgi:DNA replication protein DnaC
LIIDDFLLTTPAEMEQRDLLEVVEDRYQLGATVIASQCPIGDWHPNLGDPTLADAICDRLLHNAYRIELRGDSMRTRLCNTSKNERKETVADDGKMS